MSANRTILYNSNFLRKLRCFICFFCCNQTKITQFNIYKKNILSFKIKNKISKTHKYILITVDHLLNKLTSSIKRERAVFVDEFGFYGAGVVNIIKNEQTRKNLLEYCKLDTLAMVEILNKLHI